MAEADIPTAAMSSMMANHNTGDSKMMMSSHAAPMNIATISAGFEKGDFLVREEQGNRVYFDFFEEVRDLWHLCCSIRRWSPESSARLPRDECSNEARLLFYRRII
jgi:hypothetical protein